MNRGARRYPTFIGDNDRRSFLRLVGDVAERFGVEFHAYCLMGNHYHLLLHTPDENLSEAMQYLGSVYTQRFNRVHGFDGPLFRGRFRSKVIEDDNYLIAVARYIERNPLAFTDQLDAYPWSSFRSYLGFDQAPAWLTTSVVLSLFNNRADRYARCVFDDNAVVSDEQLAKDLEASVVSQLVSHAAIEAAVLAESSAHRSQLTVGGQGSGNEQRLLLVYLCSEFTGSSASDLAAMYGFSGPGSVRSALHRARARIDNDQGFAARVLDAVHLVLDGSAGAGEQSVA